MFRSRRFQEIREKPRSIQGQLPSSCAPFQRSYLGRSYKDMKHNQNNKSMNTKSPSVEKRIILDLCGGTGSWSKPYLEAGYDVRVITLPECDVADYTPYEKIYGILAAPPCTEFSLAKS